MIRGLSSWQRAAVGGGRGRGRGRGAARRARVLRAAPMRGVPGGGGGARCSPATVVSGPELELLRPRHWDELFAGLGGGMQALGTVRLPYASADPWPRIVLELLGTELLILAGLLTFWPRSAPAPSVRAPLAVPDRGYPFIALGRADRRRRLAGACRSAARESLLLGLALAALSVCFLWLERLPLRPGMGVAALLAIALAGALPLAAMADRGEPWFDYRSFAESLGPDDPVRFSWTQSYGPIDWPRNGNEVMRVTSRRAAVLEGAQPRRVRRHGVDGPRRARRGPARRRAVRGRRPVELGDATGLAEQDRLQYPPGTDARTSSAPARRSASTTRRARFGPGCRRALGMRRAAFGAATPTRRGPGAAAVRHASWRTARRVIASARTASARWWSRSSPASGRR